MSSTGLTSSAQLRYILQWFGEFSELQRKDFAPILAAASSGNKDDLALALEALSCDDKPISLFQCRIKLFNEWYPNWSDEEKGRLMRSVRDLDKDFAEKLDTISTDETKMNGNCSDARVTDDEENTGEESEVVVGAGLTDNIVLEIAAAT